MYKHLQDQIEEGFGCIDKMVWIMGESFGDNPSDFFEDFMELEPKEIAEILEWKTTDEVLNMISRKCEEKSLAYEMVRLNKSGFIVCVDFQVWQNFKYDENGEFSSCSNKPGYFEVAWVYANTMSELVYKINKIYYNKRQKWMDKEK